MGNEAEICGIRKRNVERVLGFFVSKGLLISDAIKPRSRGEALNLAEVILVASRLEPRIWEVLPAALLHFPKAFTNYHALPVGLRNVLKKIQAGHLEGEDFRGIKYADMYRWCNVSLYDKRVKPQREKRQLKSFRLSPACIAKLQSLAKKQGETETAVIEQLIQSAS